MVPKSSLDFLNSIHNIVDFCWVYYNTVNELKQANIVCVAEHIEKCMHGAQINSRS